MNRKLSPTQLQRKIMRDRRARRLDFMRLRRPNSVRTSILAAAVALDRLHVSMERTARSAVRATVSMSKMDATR